MKKSVIHDEVCIETANYICSEKLKQVGKNIRTMRKESGLKQRDVAFYINCDESFISAIERGKKSNITILSLTRISMFYGVNPEDLLKPENHEEQDNNPGEIIQLSCTRSRCACHTVNRTVIQPVVTVFNRIRAFRFRVNKLR